MKNHTIDKSGTPKDALRMLDKLAANAILFLVDERNRLIGSITDGDIRRGFIGDLTLDSPLLEFIQPNPKYFRQGESDIAFLKELRNADFKIIPVIDNEDRIVDIVNFKLQKSLLPLDAVIMAGGLGSRLKPLTDNLPKPMLPVGGKPIVEYNVDLLKRYGVQNLYFSIKYLGQKIIDHFGDGSARKINISYLTEDKPLGTIGAVRQIGEVSNDYILVMNSDILTNIDLEDMFVHFRDADADMIVATVPYEVKIPYGVVETENNNIIGLTEKPTYTYYSNAGIYMIKKSKLNLIPKDSHYNATDLIKELYSGKGKVIHYPIVDYWLDIGKPHDYEKAQRDIIHIKF